MTSDPIIPTLRVATETNAATPDTSSAGLNGNSGGGSPGRMIRAAREREKIGIEELAVQTRLTRPTLEALESDDFTILHEAVYVRGYYRKCAKVLKLPEAELLAAYDRLLGPKAPPMPTKLLLGNSGSTMGSMRRSGGPSLIVLLVVAVAIGVAIWFMLHDPEDLTPTVGSVVTPVTTPAPALDAPSSVPAGEFSAPAPAAPDAALPAEPQTTAGAVPAADAAAASGTAPAAAAGAGALVMDFNADSWVRVEDADGRLLLSGTQRAGDHQVLRGRLPYALFLGNAPGVTLVFDGKPFDLKPHTRDNSTARIALPFVEPVAAPAPAAP